MQNRRKSRELALKILFQNEFQTAITKADIKALIQSSPQLYRHHDDQIDFALEILEGLQTHQKEVNEQIKKSSLNWKTERMALVDLNIMRIAVFEILHKPDIPKKVSLNEALELSKIFGGKESPAFINGVLDQVEKKL